jgi:hypothetical protein
VAGNSASSAAADTVLQTLGHSVYSRANLAPAPGMAGPGNHKPDNEPEREARPKPGSSVLIIIVRVYLKLIILDLFRLCAEAQEKNKSFHLILSRNSPQVEFCKEQHKNLPEDPYAKSLDDLEIQLDRIEKKLDRIEKKLDGKGQ